MHPLREQYRLCVALPAAQDVRLALQHPQQRPQPAGDRLGGVALPGRPAAGLPHRRQQRQGGQQVLLQRVHPPPRAGILQPLEIVPGVG